MREVFDLDTGENWLCWLGYPASYFQAGAVLWRTAIFAFTGDQLICMDLKGGSLQWDCKGWTRKLKSD